MTAEQKSILDNLLRIGVADVFRRKGKLTERDLCFIAELDQEWRKSKLTEKQNAVLYTIARKFDLVG